MGAAALGCAVGDREDDKCEQGRSIWDVFDVGDRLGSGNFGEVRVCYRRNRPTSEELAVKIVDRQSANVRAAEAFQTPRDELDIMSGLSHPNVVELKHIFEDERYLYVVMELVAGGELFKAISSKGAVVMEDDVARIAMQTLDALEYLHSLGIVHRDIKAQNMLLTEKPQVPGRALMNAEVKLIDFGLATRIRQECLMGRDAQLDLVCGTPAMCAPEIWAAQESAPKNWKKWWGPMYGMKVDVWATGVVLYMALFGKLPFHERKPSRLAQRVCDPDDKPSFEGKSYRVSPGCKSFLGSLLQKDQHARPSSSQACMDGWLQGRNARGRKTRGLVLEEIPLEVREAALREAEAALLQPFPTWVHAGDDDSVDDDALLAPRGCDSARRSRVASAAEMAERNEAFEKVRRQEAVSRAFARAGPPRRGAGRTGLSPRSSSASDNSEDEDTRVVC